MGAQIRRMRRGREYLYYAYYEDGNRREMYCGPVSSPASVVKALQCEMDELTRQREAVRIRINEVETEIAVRESSIRLDQEQRQA